MEYSRKGIPHAIVHAPELVKRGGHHGAFCTSPPEAGHKFYIKLAAKFALTHASHNTTKHYMLQWVLRQQVWDAVIALSKQECCDPALGSALGSSSPSPVADLDHVQQFHDRLGIDKAFKRASSAPIWETKFLSKKVRITTHEFFSIFRSRCKLGHSNIQLAKTLKWDFYGGLTMSSTTEHGKQFRRKFVGISSKSPGRQDFVRLNSTWREDGDRTSTPTVLAAKVHLHAPRH